MMLIHFLSMFIYPTFLIFFSVKVTTLKYCCGLGINYADSGLKCSSFQTPIAGIQKEDENACLNSIEVCCKNQYRILRCNLGKEDAKSGKNCTSSDNSDEGDDVKKVYTKTAIKLNIKCKRIVCYQL